MQEENLPKAIQTHLKKHGGKVIDTIVEIIPAEEKKAEGKLLTGTQQNESKPKQEQKREKKNKYGVIPQDPYAVLGIAPGATNKEIKKAHAKAVEKFKDIKKTDKDKKEWIAHIDAARNILENPKNKSKIFPDFKLEKNSGTPDSAVATEEVQTYTEDEGDEIIDAIPEIKPTEEIEPVTETPDEKTKAPKNDKKVKITLEQASAFLPDEVKQLIEDELKKIEDIKKTIENEPEEGMDAKQKAIKRSREIFWEDRKKFLQQEPVRYFTQRQAEQEDLLKKFKESIDTRRETEDEEKRSVEFYVKNIIQLGNIIHILKITEDALKNKTEAGVGKIEEEHQVVETPEVKPSSDTTQPISIAEIEDEIARQEKDKLESAVSEPAPTADIEREKLIQEIEELKQKEQELDEVIRILTEQIEALPDDEEVQAETTEEDTEYAKSLKNNIKLSSEAITKAESELAQKRQTKKAISEYRWITHRGLDDEIKDLEENLQLAKDKLSHFLLLEKLLEKKEAIKKDRKKNPFKYFIMEKISPEAFSKIFSNFLFPDDLDSVKRYLGETGEKVDFFDFEPKLVTPFTANCVAFSSNGFTLQLQNIEEVTVKDNGKETVVVDSPNAKYKVVGPDWGTRAKDISLSEGRKLLKSMAKKYQEEQLKIFESRNS